MFALSLNAHRILYCLLGILGSVAVHSSSVYAQKQSKPEHAQSAQKPERTAYQHVLKDIRFQAKGRLFVGYQNAWIGDQQYHAFRMREFQLSLQMDWKKSLGLAARLEVIRSAQPQSLFGVDGDAYIIRIQQAWAFGRVRWFFLEAEVRLGLIQEPWIELIQEGYILRDIEPLFSQSSDFFSPSDLGLSAHIRLWKGIVELRATLSNGEGTNRDEQNNGKNTTITLSLRAPSFKLFDRSVRVGLHGIYRDGSKGAARQANHRWGAALTGSMAGYALGVEWLHAQGWRNNGTLAAQLLSIWIAGDVWPQHIGILGRLDRLNTNIEQPQAHQQTITAGVYWRSLERWLHPIFPRFRLYVYYQYTDQEANSTPFPGVPSASSGHQVMLQLSIRTAVSTQLRPTSLLKKGQTTKRE